MDSEKKTDVEARRPSINATDVDAALEYLNHENASTFTELDEKRLVRKIDWRIVPIMYVTIFFSSCSDSEQH